MLIKEFHKDVPTKADGEGTMRTPALPSPHNVVTPPC